MYVCIVAIGVRRSRGEMYIDQDRLCVCMSFPRRIPTLLHGPGCNLGNVRCPLVVQYWADLQAVHGFHCYDNIAPNAKCQRVLVLGLCLVKSYIRMYVCIAEFCIHRVSTKSIIFVDARSY